MDAKQNGGGRQVNSQPADPPSWPDIASIGEGSNIDAIFLNFAKAFDKGDHELLLHKLNECAWE